MIDAATRNSLELLRSTSGARDGASADEERGPRVVFAMAERGLLPSTLAHVSQRFMTPDRSILFFTLLVAGVSFSGAFAFLATVVSLAGQVIALGGFASFVRLQLKGREAGGDGVKPAWAFIVFLGVCFAVYIGAQAPLRAFVLLGGMILAGALLSSFTGRAVTAHPDPTRD